MERTILLLGLLAICVHARDCGVPNLPNVPDNGRTVVNGEEAPPNAYPWVVTLETSYGGQGLDSVSLHCAGSVISPDWVVTAGHCVDMAYSHRGLLLDQTGLNVYFGKHDLREVEEGEVRMNVPKANLIRNANFSKYHLADYDIAVIHLPEPITYTDHIQPICLPESGATKPAGTKLMNVGWGYMDNTQQAYVLQQGEDEVMDRDACQEYFGPYGYTITDQMMCTTSEPTAVCRGDSGGPVMWLNENGQYFLQGTVSYRIRDPVELCLLGTPAVSSNVANLREWIKEVTGV